MTHELKITCNFFTDIFFLNKNFEIRKNDRDFKVNDTLILKEYDDIEEQYTGCEAKCKVIYILKSEEFPQGIKEGYCVMGIKVLEYNDFSETIKGE
jgi:hypothetical protein